MDYKTKNVLQPIYQKAEETIYRQSVIMTKIIFSASSKLLVISSFGFVECVCDQIYQRKEKNNLCFKSYIDIHSFYI